MELVGAETYHLGIGHAGQSDQDSGVQQRSINRLQGQDRHVIDYQKVRFINHLRCHLRFTRIALTLGTFWSILPATTTLRRSHDEV